MKPKTIHNGSLIYIPVSGWTVARTKINKHTQQHKAEFFRLHPKTDKTKITLKDKKPVKFVLVNGYAKIIILKTAVKQSTIGKK